MKRPIPACLVLLDLGGGGLWESMSRAGQLRFDKFSGKLQVARFTAVVEKLVRLGSESAAA